MQTTPPTEVEDRSESSTEVKTERVKKTIRFYLDSHDDHLASFIKARGHELVKYENKGYDVQLFTNGPEVSPFLYGEHRHPKTAINLAYDNLRQSVFRSKDFMHARVGIGNGACFLSVMSGDTLWQRVDNHRVEKHPCRILSTAKVFDTSSTHHAMINMKEHSQGTLLAASNVSTKLEGDDACKIINDDTNRKYDWNDPEVVYYWNTNSLCFMYLPYVGNHKSGEDYFWETVEEHFGYERKAT